MNTNHINTFLAVYRAGDFISVAKDRNVAPSSITRSIATLEAALKTQLFHRSTRRVSPTEAGDKYFHKMTPIMEAFDHTHDTLRSDKRGPSGRLRVTASVSYGQIVIAPKLKAFRERYPDIELELVLSDGRIDLIAQNIDVAIRHGRLPDSSMTARKLSDVTYKLVGSPGYLNRNAPITSPKDLEAHDLITFSYEDFRDEWHFKKGQSSKAVPIKPVITVSNAAAICECVREGVGVALLADWTVNHDLTSGQLIEILPDYNVSGNINTHSIWLIYPTSRFVPAKTKAFTTFMLE